MRRPAGRADRAKKIVALKPYAKVRMHLQACTARPCPFSSPFHEQFTIAKQRKRRVIFPQIFTDSCAWSVAELPQESSMIEVELSQPDAESGVRAYRYGADRLLITADVIPRVFGDLLARAIPHPSATDCRLIRYTATNDAGEDILTQDCPIASDLSADEFRAIATALDKLKSISMQGDPNMTEPYAARSFLLPHWPSESEFFRRCFDRRTGRSRLVILWGIFRSSSGGADLVRANYQTSKPDLVVIMPPIRDADVSDVGLNASQEPTGSEVSGTSGPPPVDPRPVGKGYRLCWAAIPIVALLVIIVLLLSRSCGIHDGRSATSIQLKEAEGSGAPHNAASSNSNPSLLLPEGPEIAATDVVPPNTPSSVGVQDDLPPSEIARDASSPAVKLEPDAGNVPTEHPISEPLESEEASSGLLGVAAGDPLGGKPAVKLEPDADNVPTEHPISKPPESEGTGSGLPGVAAGDPLGGKPAVKLEPTAGDAPMEHSRPEVPAPEEGGSVAPGGAIGDPFEGQSSSRDDTSIGAGRSANEGTLDHMSPVFVPRLRYEWIKIGGDANVEQPWSGENPPPAVFHPTDSIMTNRYRQIVRNLNGDVIFTQEISWIYEPD